MNIRPRHALLVVALALTGVAAVRDRYNVDDDDAPPPAHPTHPSRPELPAELLVSPVLADTDAFGYPADVVDKRHVLELLHARDFAALERELDSLGRLVATDVRYEYNLRDAYAAFAHTDSTLGAPLDAWVAASPASPAAHLARAENRIARAWRARGADLAVRTSDSSFAGMEAFLSEAVQDVAIALRRDDHAYVGYSQLLDVAQLSGGPEAGLPIVTRALALYPDSYLLRQDYMEILSPRWGGSYEAMDAFARDAQSRVARNRRLGALLASSLAERGLERCCTEHDLPAALATYDSAVAVAPEREFLLARGRIRGQLRDYLGALADFNAAWQQRPQGPRTLDARAKTYLTIAAFASPEQMGKLLDLAQADVGVLTAVTNDMPAALEEAQTLDEARAWHARVHGH